MKRELLLVLMAVGGLVVPPVGAQEAAPADAEEPANLAADEIVGGGERKGRSAGRKRSPS